MRLFVVRGSPPEPSVSAPAMRRTNPQPPGPGFPEHAPSVKSSTSNPVGMCATYRGVRRQAPPHPSHAEERRRNERRIASRRRCGRPTNAGPPALRERHGLSATRVALRGRTTRRPTPRRRSTTLTAARVSLDCPSPCGCRCFGNARAASPRVTQERRFTWFLRSAAPPVVPVVVARIRRSRPRTRRSARTAAPPSVRTPPAPPAATCAPACRSRRASQPPEFLRTA